MLIASGNLKPSKEQLAMIKGLATNDFTRIVSAEFFQPTLDMMLYGEKHTEFESNATLVKGKNISPHTDPWCGKYPEPIVRRNLFWLAYCSPNSHADFYHGKDATKLYAGDWVIFDDSIVHSLESKYTWYGMILELRNAFMKEVDDALTEHHYTRDHTKFFSHS